ncbi:asparaginase [Noviherbaspirillum denitrificans]|uniref:Asparagine amidohydrolase n=1 Tax=Noviherbaspirillum denitrificans TaxID=1968433 RepID=A0A254TFT6_9BURK|nr:asparaginase [Noviherbaspirillum denitrificans]OWW21511.1 asparagine amidohydrolase [Noviherbaspirillum denitrificans]
MNFAPLAEVIRGNTVESVHYGAVAVVNLRGELLFHAGDPHFLTFTRSTIKPFQALPFLRGGGPAHFGFGSREVALLCASHSGEAMHTTLVESMLHKAGCDEHHLQCGCHVPLHYATENRQPAPGETFTQLHNNCSGKHAGFLAWCRQHGQPVESYLDPMHPLQRAIRTTLADFAGVDEGSMPAGIDGCSAPNYALPLLRLAYAYARLAQAGPDPVHGELTAQLFGAMTSHPELVSGTGRVDLALMQAGTGDWVAKGGAEGVQVLGIRSAGLGIALKAADGNARGLQAATVAVLRQLGLLPQHSGLDAWLRPQLHNLRGLRTGEVRPSVVLEKA